MKTILKLKNIFHKRQKGQILVILALIFMGLMGIIGLAIDLGMTFVNYSRLRRAVDSAALAATGEFKRGYTIAKMRAAAGQMLTLNEITDTTNIQIETCESMPGDPRVCTNPLRKLVFISVSQNAPLYFMPIFGIQFVPITVDTVSEAASVDVILAIDTSESMTNAAPYGSLYGDPKLCNESDPNGLSGTTPSFDTLPGPDGIPGECHPFEEVKNAAKLFTDQLYFPYDRVGIVIFDQYPYVELAMSDNIVVVQDTVKNLQVFPNHMMCPYTLADGPDANMDLGQPCRLYRDDTGSFYEGFDCGSYWYETRNPSKCTSTNIGGGMAVAGNMLGGAYPSDYTGPKPPLREEALWVTILLTDGAANAGYNESGQPICPPYTWSRNPFCRDKDSTERHDKSNTSMYDADDFARDMIDFVGTGQQSLIFSIGLGSLVTSKNLEDDPSNPPPGEALLQYAADTGDGIYYFAPNGAQLYDIFLAIANNIATRITQ